MTLAIKVDSATGAEERIEHLPGPNGTLYSWSGRGRETTSGVLICSSILGEFATNYHRERQLSLELVSHGIGVVRFHYAGEGNSFGDRAQMTFESMCDDAAVALERADSLGFESIAILGTRLGALVAAAIAARIPRAPTIFWEPAVEPLSFISDAHVASKIANVVHSGVPDLSAWRRDLIRDGSIDLLGHDVWAPLVLSLENLTIPGLLGDQSRPILIASLGNRQRKLDVLAEELKALGNTVHTSHFQAMESSWLGSSNVVPAHDLIKSTGNWLRHRFEERS